MSIRETLIKNFLRIAKIPRESGNEKAIADFLVEVAQEHGLWCFRDNYNNVLIRKSGNVKADSIALQAHLDMVCVKTAESKHDFEHDGIDVVIDEDRVMAKGTTLGADQGVGLAMMLSIMEDTSLRHPDIEFLFTVEEETTFKGAVQFPYEKVESKRMINLDGSDDSSVFVGADGDICNAYWRCCRLAQNELPSYRVLLQGLPGGNSSEDVKLSANNAITTMAEILKDKNVFLKSINGGTSENDLAQFCEVIISTEMDVSEMFAGLGLQFERVPNNLSFSAEDTKNIINQILNLKCGYITENDASANLGEIRTSGDKVWIHYVLRSMDAAELATLNQNSKNLQNGFESREVYVDPIWKVNAQSELMKVYKELYSSQYGSYPREEVYHGAIECATIREKIKGLDIISIGSNIEKFHTVEEVTYVSSWVKIYDLLVKLLRLL